MDDLSVVEYQQGVGRKELGDVVETALLDVAATVDK